MTDSSDSVLTIPDVEVAESCIARLPMDLRGLKDGAITVLNEVVYEEVLHGPCLDSVVHSQQGVHSQR